MKKFLQILKRFTNVIRFLVTIPILCLIIIEWILDTQKRNYWYYYSSNKIEEASYIIKQDFFERTNCNREYSEECNKINRLTAKEVVETTTAHKDNVKLFLNGEISSMQFMNRTSLHSRYHKLKCSKKTILFTILYSFLLVIWYIILTDLLIKTWWYIRNWKFTWWFRYKELLNKLIKK